MRKFLQLKQWLLVLCMVLGASNLWGQSLTFDFEDEGAHRASGSNSYNSNSYSENGVIISMQYADAVTTGSPIAGTANAMGRVAKNTTNSPTIVIGPISNSGYKITGITYKTKGTTSTILTVSTSTDNNNWTTQQTVSPTPTSATSKEITNLEITDNTVYVRFQISVTSSTSSNRDIQFDDIVITRESLSNTAVTGVTLPETAEVSQGSTTTLTATVAPSDATNKNVTWSSSNISVATVDEDGVVTGILQGTATITVTTEDGSFTDECEVTVTAPVAVTGVTLNLNTASVAEGKTVTLTATVAPANAANKNVTWSTSDPSIATVSNGVVTGVAAGTATITVTTADGGHTATCTVTVTEAKGTAAHPYTVAEALAAEPATGVYVQGYISEITEVSTSYGNATYTLSDGTNTMTIYRGKYLNNVAFTSADQIEVYDKVVVYGTLSAYNSVNQLAQGNYLISQTHRLANTITVTGQVESGTAAEGTAFTLNRENNEDELTLTATATNGTVAFAIDTDNTTLSSSDYDFDDGYLVVSGTTSGYVYITASAEGNVDYYDGTTTIIVTVEGIKSDPTIIVQDESVTYGNTFTVDNTMIEGGDITVTSSNTSVATVEGLVITPIAVGTTTITVSTAANANYNAGSETFTLTVTEPSATNTAPAAEAASAIFTETFDQCDGTGGNDDNWSGNIATGNPIYDNNGWTLSGGGKANQCVKLNKGANIQSPSINVNGASMITLSFKVAGWGTEGGNLALSVDDDNATFSSNNESFTGSTWSNHEVTISGISESSIQITFTAPSGKRLFLDEVVVTKPATNPTESVTLNGSGYTTYCSQYPLDLSNLPTGVKAYVISSETSESVTLEEVDEAVAGGTGIILQGTANQEVTMTFEDSDYEPTNLLVGTLAPKYVEQDAIYGLKGNVFQPNNAGAFPANKAYLPNTSGNVKALTIVFNDADGIQRTETITDAETIYSLTGIRLAQPRKGINIVNGKKVFIK